MTRLFVLQIIIVFLFLSNNSIATNQNIFDDAKIYFEKKDYDQSKFLFQKFLLICSKLCNNKSIIAEKIKNFEPKKSIK